MGIFDNMNVPCPGCKKSNPVASASCATCGRAFAPGELAGTARKGCLVGSGLVLLVLFVGLIMLTGGGDSDIGKTAVNGQPARHAAASSQPVAAADRQALVRSYWRAVLGAGMPCESESKATMDAIEGLARNPSGLVDAYDAARAAQSVCSNAWSTVEDIELADAAGPRAVEAAEQASALCSDLYFSRRQGLGQIMEMLDGDVSASAQSDLRARSDEVGSQQIGCIARLAGVGERVGLELSDLQAVIAEVSERETP